MDLNEMRRCFKEKKERNINSLDFHNNESSLENKSHDDEECSVQSLTEIDETRIPYDNETQNVVLNKDVKCNYLHTYPDGAVFDGMWENGKRNGEGTQIWEDGSKYIGSWKNDLRHGLGSMNWVNGCNFEGYWINDRFAQGLFTYADGARYSGCFNSDRKRDGFGTYIWKDGSSHCGLWKEDKRHGPGKDYGENGQLLKEGTWVDDIFHDYCKVSVDISVWDDATHKAINLLFQLEKCCLLERFECLEILEVLSVPSQYEPSWSQIMRIWRIFAKDLSVDTKTLPNPDGVKYSQRPFPILGSSGVQDLIREIIKNT